MRGALLAGLALCLGLSLLGAAVGFFGAESALPWLSEQAEWVLSAPGDLLRFRLRHGAALATPGVLAGGLLALANLRAPKISAPLSGFLGLLPLGTFCLGAALGIARMSRALALEGGVQPLLSIGALRLYQPGLGWSVAVSALAGLILWARTRPAPQSSETR